MTLFTDTITDKQARRKRSWLGIIALSAVLSLVISSGMVYAAGFEGKGKGVRNTGMGTTGTGMAEDWTAIYYNPAGLAFLTGHQLYIACTWSPLMQESSSSLSNFKSPFEAKGWEGEIGRFEFLTDIPDESQVPFFRYNKVEINKMVTPELGWYRNFGRYSIGVAMYGAAGTGTEWEDRLPLYDYNGAGGARRYVGDIAADVEVAMFAVAIPICMSMKVTDQLAIGFNISMIYSRDDRKTYKEIAARPDDNGLPYQIDPFAATPDLRRYQSYEFILESYANGMGFAPELGIMYKPFDNMNIGCLVRFPYKTTSTGESRLFFSDYITAQKSITEGSKYVPWKVGVGASWKPKHNLTFALDLYWVQHSKFKFESAYKNKQFAFYSEDSDGETEFWHMKDTLQVMVGGEYVFKETYAIRLGMYTDPTSIKDESVSLTTARNSDVYAPTIGFGYKRKKYELDFSAVIGLDEKRTVVKQDQNGQDYEESIEGTSYFFSFGWTYNFRE